MNNNVPLVHIKFFEKIVGYNCTFKIMPFTCGLHALLSFESYRRLYACTDLIQSHPDKLRWHAKSSLTPIVHYAFQFAL